MKIDRIELRLLRLPLLHPFRTSFGRTVEKEFVLVRLLSGGLEAWGECVADATPYYSAETNVTAWHLITGFLGPTLLGLDFSHPREVFPAFHAVRGHNMAKAALEMACWDVAARQRGVALSRLLGGTRDRVVTGISIGIQASPQALVERARRAREDGYRKIKLKIQPGADVEYVRAVREALGPDVHIMADANSAYRESDADHLARLDDFDLLMLEQPLGRDDLVRHARLQKRLRTPICLDESITDVDRAEDMIALAAGRIVNIKPGRVGGFAVSRAIHDLCARHGVPVWCGGMLESGVGRAHNVALASLPNFTLPGDLSPSARYWERDVVIPEWTMDSDGMVAVPLDRPGIGVELDHDRIAELTVREERLEPRAVPA